MNIHTYIHTNIHTYIHRYKQYIDVVIHQYIHTCIYTYTHTYIHTHIHGQNDRNTHIHIHIHTYTHRHTHTHIHTHIHTHTYTHTHTQIHTHTHTHTYIHTYTHTLRRTATRTYLILRWSVDTVPSSRTLSSWTGIPITLTIHSWCTPNTRPRRLLSRQVVKRPRGTGTGVTISRIVPTDITSRADISGVIGCVGYTVVAWRAGLTGLLIGQILVGSCRTTNGKVRTSRAVVASRTNMADDWMDGSLRALTVVKH